MEAWYDEAPRKKHFTYKRSVHYKGDINPFAFDSLPKHGMSFEASKGLSSEVKVQERNKFKVKE